MTSSQNSRESNLSLTLRFPKHLFHPDARTVVRLDCGSAQVRADTDIYIPHISYHACTIIEYWSPLISSSNAFVLFLFLSFFPGNSEEPGYKTNRPSKTIGNPKLCKLIESGTGHGCKETATMVRHSGKTNKSNSKLSATRRRPSKLCTLNEGSPKTVGEQKNVQVTGTSSVCCLSPSSRSCSEDHFLYTLQGFVNLVLVMNKPTRCIRTCLAKHGSNILKFL